MNKLSPNHIDHCTRRIAKWAKAIRLIHALEVNLPETFPEPDSIVPGKKPFNLRVVWDTDGRSRADNLCKQIKEALDFEASWHHHWRDETFELRGRIRLGEKTTMNLQLIVTYYTLR
jgi:hypothetical protein